MTRFELDSIWHNRIGDYKVVDNDGDNIIVEYVSGNKTGEMDSFGRDDKKIILRIHKNIIADKEKERAMGYGKAHRDSVAPLVEMFNGFPKDQVIIGTDLDSILCGI